MLNFLQQNQIQDMAGLDEKFKSMIGEQLDIQGKMKPASRRLTTLKKHMEQSDIYFKYKGKKPLTESGQIRKSVCSKLFIYPTNWKLVLQNVAYIHQTMNNIISLFNIFCDIPILTKSLFNPYCMHSQ